MPVALEITLIAAVVALGFGVLPLLFQMRRTVADLGDFLLSARKDLAQIAGDMHATRLRMDHLTSTLQISIDELSIFTRLLSEAGQGVRNIQNRFHNTIDSASRNLGGVIGGISAVLAFFKCRKPQAKPD